jgi:dTDP-4-dehydrorhamnose reductase
MKILLFGKNGQVGRELQRTLLQVGEVIALGRSEADFEAGLENPSSLNNVLHAHAPDIIVNAAAYTAVDKAESDEATALKINAEAVAMLADYARNSGATLVHFSSDYVFDGEKIEPYIESDDTNPQNAYGRSKRAGEEAIQQSGCNALIFRTSWVFSRHGSNFVKTILRLAKERETLDIVADQFGAPTSASLIADVTAQALARSRSRPIPNGIYHLTASGRTSWHELASRVVGRALFNGTELKLDAAKIRAIRTEEYPVPAKRPKNSLLNTNALTTALGLNLPDWSIHVDCIVDQLTGIESST